MCAQAIRTARIDTVVFGSTTLGIGAVSSRYPILTDATIVELPPPPTVVADVLGDACRALRQRPA
jgi:tRNA(Arg) A34 adenosine deaminase TadA